jgi:hypothetical protein
VIQVVLCNRACNRACNILNTNMSCFSIFRLRLGGEERERRRRRRRSCLSLARSRSVCSRPLHPFHPFHPLQLLHPNLSPAIKKNTLHILCVCLCVCVYRYIHTHTQTHTHAHTHRPEYYQRSQFALRLLELVACRACLIIRQHTSASPAYASIRQHISAYSF